MAQMVSTSERTGLLNRELRVRVPSGAQEKIEEFFEDIGKMGLHVPRLAFLPCKERVEGSIPFGSTHKFEKVSRQIGSLAQLVQ